MLAGGDEHPRTLSGPVIRQFPCTLCNFPFGDNDPHVADIYMQAILDNLEYS